MPLWFDLSTESDTLKVCKYIQTYLYLYKDILLNRQKSNDSSLLICLSLNYKISYKSDFSLTLPHFTALIPRQSIDPKKVILIMPPIEHG